MLPKGLFQSHKTFNMEDLAEEGPARAHSPADEDDDMLMDSDDDQESATNR